MQGHAGGTLIDPTTMQDNVLLPDDFAENIKRFRNALHYRVLRMDKQPVFFTAVNPMCMKSTMCDFVMTLFCKHDWRLKACSIHVRCAHTVVRMSIVHLSCVCLWSSWRRKNKQLGRLRQWRDGVSVQDVNVHVMYKLSHVKNWEYLHPVSCHIQISRRVLRCVTPTSVALLANVNREPDHSYAKFSKSVLFVSVTAHSSSQCVNTTPKMPWEYSENICEKWLRETSEMIYSITTRSFRTIMWKIGTESSMTQMLMTTETTMPQRTSPFALHCTTERAHVVLFLAHFITLTFGSSSSLARTPLTVIIMAIHVVVVSST